ncbi:ABC transporter ATP-binding protein [Embleya sp. NPDC020630]|uniref:ABC transporter ATP-binding protein n=1 Tax=Embleya sp. NPDC020630 TaxID=3363979 RepID=UPI0037BBA1B0
MIEARGLTKRYGTKRAVDQLSFQVRPGSVTGFLGPNGAGKSTTMRMILGLDEPSGGDVTVNGRPYRNVRAPLREMGALLDAKAMHGGRTAYNHLLCLAQSNGIPHRRVDEVLGMVGLSQVARKRSNGFSLGMGQRLGIASALLGDPGILMFDEPVNGLDPEGILWIRNLMKQLASEGRTVFVSSHLMSEMEVTADHLIVIGAGRMIADTSMRDFIETNSQAFTVVRSPEVERLKALIEGKGARMSPDRGTQGSFRVHDIDPAGIGDLAAEHGIALHELSPRFDSLEEVYMRLTQHSVEYRAGVPGGPPPGMHPAMASGTVPPGFAQPGSPPPAQPRPGAAPAGSPSTPRSDASEG